MPFHISMLIHPPLCAFRYIKCYLFFEASPHSRERNSPLLSISGYFGPLNYDTLHNSALIIFFTIYLYVWMSPWIIGTKLFKSLESTKGLTCNEFNKYQIDERKKWSRYGRDYQPQLSKENEAQNLNYLLLISQLMVTKLRFKTQVFLLWVNAFFLNWLRNFVCQILNIQIRWHSWSFKLVRFLKVKRHPSLPRL